jgi:hypothetical protein
MAKNSSAVTKAEHERLRFARWVLFLVNAAEAAGIGSLSRRRLHALLFVSFASSRFYGIEPLRQRAQRTEQGPYYRAAHVALGMLALSGLVDLEGFAAHPSPKDLQFEGTFIATSAGLELAAVLRQTYHGEALYRYLLDLCLGTVDALIVDEPDKTVQHPRPTLDTVLEEDLTYQQAIRRPGNALLVEESVEGEVTPTLRGLRSISEYLLKRMPVNGKDVLGAYQRLLQRRVA